MSGRFRPHKVPEYHLAVIIITHYGRQCPEMMRSKTSNIHIHNQIYDTIWWIGRMGNEDLALEFWPQRSPDITLCNFFLWGCWKMQSMYHLFPWIWMILETVSQLVTQGIFNKFGMNSTTDWMLSLQPEEGIYWTSVNFFVCIIKCNLQN